MDNNNEIIMSEAQKLAYELYIDSPSLANDWTPITEKALQTKLKENGFAVGAGTINRWKKKFNWVEAMEAKLAIALGSDESKEIVKSQALKSVVKNTQISIETNNMLLNAAYDIAENELFILREKSKMGALDMKDFKKFEILFKITAERDDRMLDRLAQIPRASISADEILAQMNIIDIEVEE